MLLVVKNLPAKAGDVRDACPIPGSGRSPRGGHGNPLQYSCLENPTERGALGDVEEPEIKLPTSAGSWKKRVPEKHLFLLY